MRLGADPVARGRDVRAVGYCADRRRLLADTHDHHSAAGADHDDHHAARGGGSLRRLVPMDVVKLAQRVDAHVERLCGSDSDHHDAVPDDDDHGSADDHHHNRRRVRAALDDDDIDHDHEQHDDDDGGAGMPMRLSGVLRLGGWGVYSHDVRGWRTDALNPVHDDDEQHDDHDAIMRLRDDDHEHDDGRARLHGRVYVGRRAAAERVRHVGLGEEDRPVRLRVSVPTAND